MRICVNQLTLRLSSGQPSSDCDRRPQGRGHERQRPGHGRQAGLSGAPEGGVEPQHPGCGMERVPAPAAIQDRSGRGRGDRGESGVHESALCGLRPHRERQQEDPEQLRLPGLRPCRQRRRERCEEHLGRGARGHVRKDKSLWRGRQTSEARKGQARSLIEAGTL